MKLTSKALNWYKRRHLVNAKLIYQKLILLKNVKYDVNWVALGIMGVKAISNLSKCNRKNSPFVYLIHPAKQEISHKCNLLIEDNGSYSPTK